MLKLSCPLFHTMIASGEGNLLNHLENMPKDYTLDRSLEVQHLNNALVMPITGAISEENFVHRGGVYSENGAFSLLSGRTRMQDLVIIGPYPTSVISKTLPTTTHSKPAVFCGLLDNHFGHFMLEATSRLWWGLQTQFQYNYVFQMPKNQPIPPFATAFFELLGIADRIVYIREPTRFEYLTIPEPAFQIQSFFHTNFLIPFSKIRKKLIQENSGDSPKKVYFSRTRLKHRQTVGEDTVEKMFSSVGFEIVYPESLSLIEQINLTIGADEIAGVVGSALHLMVFSHKVKVIYIIPGSIKNLNYSIVDQATSAMQKTIFAGAGGILKPPKFNKFKDALFLLDLHKVQEELVKSGYEDAGHIEIPSAEALTNLYWSSWEANDKANQS